MLATKTAFFLTAIYALTCLLSIIPPPSCCAIPVCDPQSRSSTKKVRLAVVHYSYNSPKNETAKKKKTTRE